MAEVKATDVQALRKATGAGMMEVKKALVEAEGDRERAAQILRERGIVSAAKRQERESTEGAVAYSAIGDRVAALVELRCETDFVAKSDDFVNTANEIAAAVAESGEEAVGNFKEMVEKLQMNLKENIFIGRVARHEALEGETVSAYLHHQADRGVNGVLVKLAGSDPETAHEVALHIAFARPTYLSREDVPQEVLEAERRTFETITRNEGKPEAQLPKIVQGRLNGFYKDVCLLEQPYVKDEKKKIADLVAPGRVVSFVQIVIGE